MDWARPELLVKIPIGLANNRCTTVINLHQDSCASTHSNLFQGQTYRGKICWLTHFRETGVPQTKQNKDKVTQGFSATAGILDL